MDEVTFETNANKRDFYRGMRSGYRVSSLDCILLACFVIIGFLLYALGHPFWVWIVAPALGLILIFSIHYFVVPSRVWHSTSSQFETKRTTYSDEGITVTSSNGTLNIDWAEYAGTRETAKYYFLDLRDSRLWIFVRKSNFKSRDEEEVFRRILKRNTKARLRR